MGFGEQLVEDAPRLRHFRDVAGPVLGERD
jgi:hypothetical protein